MTRWWRRIRWWWVRREPGDYVSAAWLHEHEAAQLVLYEGVSSKWPWPNKKSS